MIKMKLKELRRQSGMTQNECAKYLKIPLRTYQNYEAERCNVDSIKYKYMLEKLNSLSCIDENHGILSIDEIKRLCIGTFEKFNIEYCYLFGSYARGTATETSDVDFLIYAKLSGLQFYELIEDIREALKKNVDVLNFEQLTVNPDLTHEILKDGIKIYGKQKK